MFKRWLEIKENNSLLLLGPRRSGKTTLLKEYFPDIQYITLDDFDYLNWAKTDPKGCIASLEKTAIIDEIQRVPELSIAVKYAIDNLQHTFYMTGSSNIGLLDTSAESLAGRIRIHHFPTLCWGEELGQPTHKIFEDQLNPIQIKNAYRTLEKALKYGGFPEIVKETDKENKNELLRNYKNTYFTRDAMQLSNIQNLSGLMGIFYHLARSLGSNLDVNSLSIESGLSHPSTKKYLNTLHQSQLLFNLLGYQYGPAKRFIKSPKIYFADNAIFQSFNMTLHEGQIIENFVISELEKRRKLRFIKSDQFYFYKSTSGHEIDLIYETEENKHFAIEIKSKKNTHPKDLKNLIKFKKEFPHFKTILINLSENYEEINGVEVIPIAALHRGI